MLAQLRDSVSSQSWTDQAIRDTIAAIAKNPAYNRELGQSLWDRALRFVLDQFSRLFEVVRETPYGRTIVVTLVVLAVALILARLVLGIVAERRSSTAAAGASGVALHGAQLSEAERLASNGEYTAAAHVLFACVLSAGSARGEFRLHPSKTSGDYARDIRRRATPWLHPFQAFRQRYDRVMYGERACSADDYQSLLRDVQSLLARDRAA